MKERFGDVQAIINRHYTELIEIPTLRNGIISLRSFLDTVKIHIRSLAVLKQDTNQDIFIPMIISKLPKEVLLQLEIQKGRNNKWTVNNLLEALENYVTARESSERVFTATSTTTKTLKEQNTSKYYKQHSDLQSKHKKTSNLNSQYASVLACSNSIKSTTGVLLAKEIQPNMSRKVTCAFCNNNHWSDECTTYTTVEDRKAKTKGRCYICLSKKHMVKECPVTKPCCHCSKKHNHHRSLCPQKFHSSYNEASTVATELDNLPNNIPHSEPANLATEDTVIMQSATTEVKNPTNSNSTKTVKLLFDSGSYRSYITQKLAKDLNLKLGKTEEIKLVTFGNSSSTVIKTPTTTIELPLKDNNTIKLSVNVVPEITGKVHRMPVKANIINSHLLQGIPLADTLPTQHETTNMDILIGNNYYLDLIEPMRIQLEGGLYLLGSKLGWILTGRTTSNSSTALEVHSPALFVNTFGTESAVNNIHFTTPDDSLTMKPSINEFWNLETIGIKDPLTKSEDDIALHNLNATIKYEDNRYFTTWPWKENAKDLPDNYMVWLSED